MVFQKGGSVSKTLKWTYKGQELQIVNNFNYLGIVMSSAGLFVPATNTLYGKALKAIHSLFNLTKDMNVPINIMFKRALSQILVCFEACQYMLYIDNVNIGVNVFRLDHSAIRPHTMSDEFNTLYKQSS